ncbi:esterase [beta proteobacterium AAP121]|nr:esterase [beta proteobacterium AAP65]KPF97081.1 esterase [beta proteobacterium AAP121]
MRTRNDPAWLEAQYNNRARVPAYASHFARWQQASKLVREKTAAQLDLPYGSGAGETLDIFPATRPGAPVLVFIHGGYWRSLDKSDFSFIAPAFNAAGAAVVVPNYALCPAVGIEHIALQMTQAVAWAWRHAAEFGADATRIGLVGHSAGGHLAAMLTCCRWKDVAPDLPALPVQAALSVSGLYDLEPLRQVASVQADLQLTPAAVRRLSPAFFPRPKGSKLYAAVGLDESEEFLRQNALIRDVWGPTAVPVCETLPGRNHFSVVEDLADAKSRLHALALRTVGLR